MAERLHIIVKTLIRRMAGAGVHGIKPGRHRLLSQADIATLPAYLERRATSLARRTPPGVPVDIRRQLHRAETSRLLKKVPRPVTKLDLERGDADKAAKYGR